MSDKAKVSVCFIHRCFGEVFTLTGEDFEQHVRDVLEELRKNIPKLFINMVLLGNVTEVC